jgi:hypothetical protein
LNIEETIGMTSSLRIIITGLIAQHRLLGGVAWDYIQYAVGLARLGYDVYYFEDSGQWPYNLDGGASGNDWVAYDCKPNVDYLSSVMSRFDLTDKWTYRFPINQEWYGLSDKTRREVVASADLLINVSGTLEHPEQYRQVRRLAYIDSDPVFTQVKLARGDIDFRKRVDSHDIHFSFGECLSGGVPPTGHYWRPTRTPIVLSEWRPTTPQRNVFTTVMNWTSYKPLVYQGKTYGQKDSELRRFIELPDKVGPNVLEVALAKTPHLDWQTVDGDLPPAILVKLRNHPEWTAKDLLKLAGWRVVDATQVCPDLDSYRRYIESSKGEWSIAKNGYVAGQPGWFSCRSACYLAAGRPVIVQDTGFAGVLPVGEGISTFETLEEAAAAISDVESDYVRQAKAARTIAEEYFASDKILTHLIDRAMSS